MPECGGLAVVVVPEGLAFDRVARRALAVPSFVGEAVLEHVCRHYAAHRILIAPANRFGAPSSEHEVMASWLADRGCSYVQTPNVSIDGYVDTWGNALELKRWLTRRGEWPFCSVRLVVASTHARRARLCFDRNGFTVEQVDIVPYTATGRPIVPRLFYYNRPRLHRVYEAFAFVRDCIRPMRAGKIWK